MAGLQLWNRPFFLPDSAFREPVLNTHPRNLRYPVHLRPHNQ